MWWIEQWFGVSPDGGTGTLEAAIVVGVLSLLAYRLRRKRDGAERQNRA